MKQRIVLEAPSRLGLSSGGVETLPKALLAAGFAEKIGARRGGDVLPPRHEDKADAVMPVIVSTREKAAEPAVMLTVPIKVDAHAARDWDGAHYAFIPFAIYSNLASF